MSLRSVLRARRTARAVRRLIRKQGVAAAVERLERDLPPANDVTGWEDLARARRIAGRVASCRAAADPGVRAVAIWRLCRQAGIDASISLVDPARPVVRVGQAILP